MSLCTESASPIKRTESLQKRWLTVIPQEPTIDVDRLSGGIEQIKDELEELVELRDKVASQGGVAKEEDIIEMSDTLVDLLEYIQQEAVKSGIADRIEADAYKIYLNNWTKVCNTTEEMVKTVDMYKEKGIEVVVNMSGAGYFVVRDAITGHVKKPYNYKKVEL